MKSASRIQRITVSLLTGYVFWEIAIWIWSRSLPPNDPIIRADLIFIYPMLLLFISLSLYQYYKIHKHKRWKSYPFFAQL
jgi:hypothetical protein